jgi:hypothetical protein
MGTPFAEVIGVAKLSPGSNWRRNQTRANPAWIGRACDTAAANVGHVAGQRLEADANQQGSHQPDSRCHFSHLDVSENDRARSSIRSVASVTTLGGLLRLPWEIAPSKRSRHAVATSQRTKVLVASMIFVGVLCKTFSKIRQATLTPIHNDVTLW